MKFLSFMNMPISSYADFYVGFSKEDDPYHTDEIYRIGEEWFWMHSEFYAEMYATDLNSGSAAYHSWLDDHWLENEAVNSMCWQAKMSGGEMWRTAIKNLARADLCVLTSKLLGKYPHTPNDQVALDLLKPDSEKGYEPFSFAA